MHKLVAGIAILFFLFIVWIIYLANTGGSSIFFDFVGSIPFGDKLGHAGLFGLLTLFAIVGSNFNFVIFKKARIYYGVIIVVLFVVIEELSQVFIPSRTFDLFDLAADLVGIILATVIVFIANRHLTHRPN